MSNSEGRTGSAKHLEDHEHRLASIEEKLALRESELAVKSREVEESNAHQAATAEVLAIISNSPSNVQPVLDKIATIACRLCEADNASVFLILEALPDNKKTVLMKSLVRAKHPQKSLPSCL